MSGPKISLSLSANPAAAASGGARRHPPTNGLKRPRSTALHDDDDDEDDNDAERSTNGRVQRVSHFDRAAGGAVDATTAQRGPSATTASPVIPRQANRNWKEAAHMRKRQKSGLPTQHSDAGAAAAAAAEQEALRQREVEGRRPQFGLTVAAATRTQTASGGTAVMGDAGAANAALRAAEAVQKQAPEPGDERRGIELEGKEVEMEEAPGRAQTMDERAVDALLGNSSTDRSLVVPQQADAMTEAEAFGHDFRAAPAMATLDEYARMPVEQFGAALLRGMGWKDGEGIGSQRGKKIDKTATKLPERRAALLGIGAKEDAAVTAEMGAWGKAARSGKEVKIYNPLMLKDKRTGELFTEEELQKKKEREERERYEMEFDKKERDRRRATREDGDRRRAEDRTDERERDRRRRDEESDEEYHRRKARERRKRHEREDRDKDSYRERSHRHRDHDERRDGYSRDDSRRHRDRHQDYDRHRERDRRR